jgi:hypothetical protein
VKPWGDGLAYVNPPWSEHRGAVVPWLRRFFAHPGGGILVCVARNSCSWFHEIVLPQARRFIKPDGSPGQSPINGIALIGVGAAACDALRRSGLGFCLTVAGMRRRRRVWPRCWLLPRSERAMTMNLRVLGVDPGICGGLAIVQLLDGNPRLIDAVDMPVVGVGAKERVDACSARVDSYARPRSRLRRARTGDAKAGRLVRLQIRPRHWKHRGRRRGLRHSARDRRAEHVEAGATSAR